MFNVHFNIDFKTDVQKLAASRSNNNDTITITMSCEPLPLMATPLQFQRPAIDDGDAQNQHNPMEFQILTSSHFRLPDGWVVEERPRASNPSHVDRYYYEPGTRRQFRSLLSVKRHLTGETRDCVISKRKNFIESGSGQQWNSLRAVENFLSGENACTATPKSAVKSGTGEKRACGVRSVRKPVHKRFSAADEKMTPKYLKHSIQSALPEKPDSQKKTKLEKDNRASMHNLTAPPPAKVSWVLSGPGGFWSPSLDDSIVPESEKLKWSEAFVLSIHNDGVTNS
ncbi:Methyl-CpG-binding domain-containing protein 7 [Glycine soja]|nr:Methyl-CpG-binding domain-containing protein 7 [Glycine soja]